MQHRGKLLLLALTVMAAFAALLVGAVGRSSATTVVAPDHVSQTVQGCRNDGTITLPNGSGQFICPDSAYTGGNLGKGWNELDLVPFRLTTTAGNAAPATQTYDTGVAFDGSDGGHPGYDVIGPLVLNTSESNASCVLVSQSAQQTITPGFGGIDTSIGRMARITQAKNSTCVFDYYGRLALGSHLFPGSSLHGNLSDGGLSGETEDVPIPVKEILPQSVSKDMAASTSGTQAWNITKSPSPAVIHYGNVCSETFSNTQPLAVTVTWTKAGITPSGQVHLITHVYATNPASRTITVTATDKMYEGSTQATQVGSTAVGSPVDVPANSTMFLVLTDDQLVSSSSTNFNDVATATYVDKATGVPVPGSTQATASATVNSTTLGQSATATDSESITGSGLTFAVATPSFGSFTGGYTAGTYGTGPVGWSSGTNAITSDGSVEFDKTIKLDPAQATSGSITDTATITPSDGGSAVNSDPLTVNIDSSDTGTLTITKTIPNVLQGTETATFQFHVYDSSNNDVADPTVTFTAGQVSKDIEVPGLALGSYTVSEDTATGWEPQDDQPVTVSGCTAGVEFDNQNAPAVAQVKKVTDPTGYESGWDMTLNGPGTPTGGETVTTTGTGFVGFTTSLQEGSYTITETPQAGWTQVSASSQCSFTVNYPADSGRTFSCTITNKSRGHVRVVKTINGAPITGSQDFQFELRLGDQHTTSTAPLETLHANSGNGGLLNFTTDLVPGQTYAICELLVATYNPTISGYGPYNPSDNANYWCWNFSITVAQAADSPSLVFIVDNSHPQSKGLTIGYWKNWSGCKKSKGNQTDVLGQYLGGIKLGTYTFTNSQTDECNAVQTLSKDTFSGTNKSSDPLFSMAAQLLAADLNVNAQAGVCAAAVTAINNGQALLVKYGWNGNTYSPKLTSADATLANSLAATLDKYNNNQLC